MTAEDEELEVAITNEWRREVKEARGLAKLTQGELGKRVGCDQETISMIENENAARPINSSRWVLKISRELKIAPPLHHLDDWQRYWSKLGYLLAAHSEQNFQSVIGVIQGFLADKKMPPRPKARAVSRVTVAVPFDPQLRNADELPGERVKPKKTKKK